MILAAFETSCDDTGVAILDEERVLANNLASQVHVHGKFGGVVPELAARKHLEAIPVLLDKSLDEAGCSLSDVDCFAATIGPGLVGSLLVGLSFAKGLAIASKKCFIGVNHLLGHLHAVFLAFSDIKYPFVVLLASGGHSEILIMESWEKYRRVGKTRDDAAGESFDKVARMLDLGYPGGPELELLASSGNPRIPFPRPLSEENNLDFSFSGLKTAVLYHLRQNPEESKEDIAASFQVAIVESLLGKTFLAADLFNISTVVIVGGVASNTLLRTEASLYARKKNLEVFFPPKQYCTDNAAMIGRAALEMLKRGIFSDLSENAVPYLGLNESY